jgi:hypothetical protein
VVPNPITKNLQHDFNKAFFESNTHAHTIREFLKVPLTLLDEYFLKRPPNWSMFKIIEDSAREANNYCRDILGVNVEESGVVPWDLSVYQPEKYALYVTSVFWSLLIEVKKLQGAKKVTNQALLNTSLAELIDLSSKERAAILSEW